MRAKVFAVKHQNAGDLVQALKPLASGATGAMFQPSETFNTVTVRDFPKILRPSSRPSSAWTCPPHPSPMWRFASGSCSDRRLAGGGQYPAELESVVKQLSATLQYKSYHLVAAITQRVRAGSGGANGKGQVVLSPPAADENHGGQFHYNIDKISLPQPAAGGPTIVGVKKLKFSLESSVLGEAEVSTGLTLREDEKVVLATGSSLKNRAMIVVVSARLLRRP